MPNHFHLLVRQCRDRGISTFAQRALNSYTRYFNIKYDRVGPLFQGKLKKVLVDDDGQLLHLSRYIHLNPYVDQLINKPGKYVWSSYKFYLTNQKNRLCEPKLILEMIGSNLDYKKFVEDYADYAKSLALIKHSQLE
jgi:putative transposase